jgi:hypothetical protein
VKKKKIKKERKEMNEHPKIQRPFLSPLPNLASTLDKYAAAIKLHCCLHSGGRSPC